MKIEKFNMKVAKSLWKDEVIETVVKVNPKGMMETAILGAAGNVGGGLADVLYGESAESRKIDGETERKEAGVELNVTQALIGLSNKRLVFWSIGFMGGPKKLLAYLKREDIQSMNLGMSKMLYVKMPALIITLKNGVSFELMVAKINKNKALSLIDFFYSKK